MRSLRRRIELAEVRSDATLEAHSPEEPAIVRWLRALKLFLPTYEVEEASEERDVILDRIRRIIAMLEEYLSPPLNAYPHAHLEYYCHACILRLCYTRADWEGRQLAFAEADYDEHMSQLDAIEKSRFAQPRVWNPRED